MNESMNFTEFVVDEKDFPEGICSDLGTICAMLHPGCRLSYDGKKDGVHHYMIDKEVDVAQLFTQIRDCHVECKAKRIERMNTIDCRVVKINGAYYILDGDLKIPLFE